jgi:mRNA interferase MazF
MTVYEKGDIILVPFPFSELTSIKKRPALVMASIEHRLHDADFYQ